MKFVDEVRVYVKSGAGGNGCISFRREKFVPMGGPDGGDGGRGGDILVVADSKLNSLLDLKYQQHYIAKRGEHGKGKNQHGKNIPDLSIKVPPGTVVKDFKTGNIIKDLVEDGDKVVVARGGKGGKGNARFATSTCQAPRYAEEGKDGEERWLFLELKLIADVGIVGFPNAGKSTLISQISHARSKSASYPFTTLIPHLGVVACEGFKRFVVADIPGLIEGAHKGVGLGIRFLKHIERTTLLLHIIDISSYPERDPLKDFDTLIRELTSFNTSLTEKKQIVVLNKIDTLGTKDILPKIQRIFKERDIETFPVSALTGQGLDSLIKKLEEMVFLVN